jgi:hypothetical protein
MSLAFSAFFTIPALAENKYTWLKSQLTGYFDYTAHFVTLKQLLISRFWGYGPSVWLEGDGMPFPVGHFHWILSIVIALFVVMKFINVWKSKSRTNYTVEVVLAFLLVMGWLATFMTHSKATPIYQALPFLGMVCVFVFSRWFGTFPFRKEVFSLFGWCPLFWSYGI